MPIHRKYAIEHHSTQEKHNYPHLQFKFHTEEIGSFCLRLSFNNSEEYKDAILGFIYKIKNILEDLEKFKPGISEDMLVLDLVNSLSKEGSFLSQKISESIEKYQIEFENNPSSKNKINSFKKNPLLIEFLGNEIVKKVIDKYQKKDINRKWNKNPWRYSEQLDLYSPDYKCL